MLKINGSGQLDKREKRIIKTVAFVGIIIMGVLIITNLAEVLG